MPRKHREPNAIVNLRLRLSPRLLNAIKAEANKNCRSINSEIVYRLTQIHTPEMLAKLESAEHEAIKVLNELVREFLKR